MANRSTSQLDKCATGVGLSPNAAQDDAAIVDYADLVTRCMGNLALAEKLLGNFEHRLEQDLQALDREINQQDADGIARVAHRLKGASASVSANRLRNVFSRLEQLGRTEQLVQVPACRDELRSEWVRFQAESPSTLVTIAGNVSSDP